MCHCDKRHQKKTNTSEFSIEYLLASKYRISGLLPGLLARWLAGWAGWFACWLAGRLSGLALAGCLTGGLQAGYYDVGGFAAAYASPQKKCSLLFTCPSYLALICNWWKRECGSVSAFWWVSNAISECGSSIKQHSRTDLSEGVRRCIFCI